MRKLIHGAAGLALLAVAAGCGTHPGGPGARGADVPSDVAAHTAARFGLLTNGTVCPTTGCQRFIGSATYTNEGGLGTRTSIITFDVTESGDADVGTITLSTGGSTPITNPAAPTVRYDGNDVVVTTTLVIFGQISGVVNLTLRFDRTNPTTLTADGGTGPVEFAVTAFQTLEGPCGPCRAYTGSGLYGDPQRPYAFNVVDKGSIQAPDDFGVVTINVTGDTYTGSAPSITNLGGLVTIAANAVRASDNADVDVTIQFNASTPTTASIFLDGLLIDPNATQTEQSASSCELFPGN